MSGMLYIIGLFLGIAVLVIPFIDNVVLRPVHKRQLQLRFETWWKTIENYDKLKLALVCASKANVFLDYVFGAKLLSKKVIFRGTIISCGILIITMSWVGLINGDTFGVTPWENYKGSVWAAESVLDMLLSQHDETIYNVATITNSLPFNYVTNALLLNKAQIIRPVTVNFITNGFILKIDTNICLVNLTKMASVTIEQIAPLGNGNVYAHYQRYFFSDETTNISTNAFGNINYSQNAYEELKNNLTASRTQIEFFDKLKYEVSYSIVYYIAVLFINSFLFVSSLIFSRIMLREMALSGRLISTISLFVTNIIALFILSCFVLLVFTVLAIPLLWFLAPVMYKIADSSMYAFLVFLSSAGFSLWIMSGISAKVIALIVFLPNVFVGFIGLFSILAMRWKNVFHFVLSKILIRCVENNPVVVILSTIVFISGLIALFAKWLHITAFL